MPKNDDTRGLIIQTAKALLRRHGEDKMTVVDIARSLDMSHANVYRYFKTKSEILDAITNEWLVKIETFVEEIALRPLPAAARIEAVVLELHSKRKQKLIEDAEVYETFRRIIALRPDVVEKRREKILNVFKRLIEEGIESGEFGWVDAGKAATVLKDATLCFLHPLTIPTLLEPGTEERAAQVVRYVLAGFATKKAETPVWR